VWVGGATGTARATRTAGRGETGQRRQDGLRGWGFALESRSGAVPVRLPPRSCIMRRWLILSVLGLAGVLGTSSRASAWWVFGGPYYTSAAFPCVNPPGYYTNLYYYGWMYPWYAYYNYSHGPYNGWWLNGGDATYPPCGHNQPARPIPRYVGGPQDGGPPLFPPPSSGPPPPPPLPPPRAPCPPTPPAPHPL